MRDSKSKDFKWAITISMILASCILLYMTFLYKLPHKLDVSNEINNVNAAQKDLYTSLATYNKDAEYPFIQTDIKNIFYTVNSDEDEKNIEFFEYSKGKFSKIKDTKQIDFNITCCEQKIPVHINYIVHKGKTVGYGTYVSNRALKTIKYAFFKLCDMPNRNESKHNLLLLVDFNDNDIYKCNKSYSQIFRLNKKSKKVSKIFSTKGCNITNSDGKINKDLTVSDDYILNSCTNKLLFYLPKSNKKSSDIYSKPNTKSSPKKVAKNTLNNFVRQTNKGIIYLKDTSKNDSDSFSLILKKKNKKDGTKIRTFCRKYNDGYIIRDNYLIDTRTMTLYNLVNDTESVLTGISINNIQTFAVSPDKTKVVILDNLKGNLQKIVFYDLTRKRSKVLEQKNIFCKDCPNLCFVDNDTVNYLAPAKSVDMPFSNFVISWYKVFSTMP